MSVSIGARPARAKAMVVSSEARPTRAKAMSVSRERFPMYAGYGGAWPGTESTHRATHQRPGTAGVEGAGGTGGHGRASRSTTPSRQARVWRSRGRPGPTAPGTTAEPQATSSIANSGCTAGVKGVRGPGCGGRGRRRSLAGHRVNAPSHTSATRRHCVEGAGGSGGHGRASRRRAERSSRRGRRAGGPPPTGAQSSPAQQGTQSSPAPQGTAQPAISGSRAPSGSPTRKQHPPGQASAPNRRRRARDPRPRR